MRRLLRRFVLSLLVLALLAIGANAKDSLLGALDPSSPAVSVAAAGTGCSTIYAVTNASAADAIYVHEFKNVSGTVVFSFSDSLPPNGQKIYDTRALQGLADGFNGSVTISSDQDLSAVINDVAGCDGLKYPATVTSIALAETVPAGQVVTAKVTVRNTSTVFSWPAGGPNPIRVGYHWYNGPNLIGKWDDGQRGVLPNDVPPGGTVTVDVPVKVPSATGNNTIWFDIVHEGVSWYGTQQIGPFGANVAVVAPYNDVLWLSATMPSTVSPGQTVDVTVQVKNTSSSFTWTTGSANPVNAGYHWLQGSNVVVWDGNRGALPGNVGPGQTTTTSIPVKAPSTPGNYTIWFDLVQEGVTWFGAHNAPSLGINVTVVSPYTSVEWISASMPASMARGQTIYVPVTVRNTSSSFIWNAGGNNPVHVGSHWLQGDQVVVWDGNRGPLPNDVAPGSTVSINVPVIAPSTPGNYTIWFDLVHEGIIWFGAHNAPSWGAHVTVQ